jgi:multisubunit Na+/H+ antiporter MnhF subunit
MARVAVALLAVGLLLATAGLFVALAVGLPALGLNPYGRNPLDETLRALAFAARLYAIGAALLAIAIRWIRDNGGSERVRGFSAVGGLIVVLILVMSVWQAVLGYWTNIPILLVFMIGIFAPIALGGWHWGRQLDAHAGS